MGLEDRQDPTITVTTETPSPETNPLTPDLVRKLAAFVKDGVPPSDIFSDLRESEAGGDDYEISICEWPYLAARKPGREHDGTVVNGYRISLEETRRGEISASHMGNEDDNPLESGEIKITVIFPDELGDFSQHSIAGSSIREYTIKFGPGYTPDTTSSMVKDLKRSISPGYNPRPISAGNFAELAEIGRAVEERPANN